MSEIWKVIPTTHCLYEASSLGRIRRVDSGHILKVRVRPRDGYVSVDLSLNGRRITRTVNTLVCEAFHGPRPEGLLSAHRNGTRADNRSDNLLWATHEENADHRWAHGTMICGEAIPHSKLTTADVIAIRRRRKAGEQLQVIAKDYGVRSQTIEKIVKGMRWKHLLLGRAST